MNVCIWYVVYRKKVNILSNKTYEYRNRKREKNNIQNGSRLYLVCVTDCLMIFEHKAGLREGKR